MLDCFVFPSKRDRLGLAALEGMAAGLTVIGYNIDGIRDYVVDVETEILVNFIDDEAIYMKVIDDFFFKKICVDM